MNNRSNDLEKKFNLALIAHKKFTQLILLLFICTSTNSQSSSEFGIEVHFTFDSIQVEIFNEFTNTFPDSTELSIAIIKGGEVEFVGLLIMNDSLSLIQNEGRVFEIGSISKVFTSSILAHALTKDLVNLEDDIQTHLKTQMKLDEVITLKHLANHTSGLPRLPSNLNLFASDINNPYKDYDEVMLREYLAELTSLLSKPGEKYDYSNLGTALLGYILCQKLDLSFEDLLQKVICSKYNLQKTTVDRQNVGEDLVFGRNYGGEITSNWDLGVHVGAGGILSSALDMSLFLLAQFDEEDLPLSLTHETSFKVSEEMEVALGWHILKKEGRNNWYWHNGATGGYTSSMAFDKDLKNGIVILSNVGAFNKDMANIDLLCFRFMNFLAEGR